MVPNSARKMHYQNWSIDGHGVAEPRKITNYYTNDWGMNSEKNSHHTILDISILDFQHLFLIPVL